MHYEIHHVGGPADGQMAFAFRPYFRMTAPTDIATINGHWLRSNLVVSNQ